MRLKNGLLSQGLTSASLQLELLDRWVGSSEKLIRDLFKDAEAELTACNGDATRSALHVIVVDEIDAAFRRRSSSEDSGETTRASAVNQVWYKKKGLSHIIFLQYFQPAYL